MSHASLSPTAFRLGDRLASWTLTGALVLASALGAGCVNSLTPPQAGCAVNADCDRGEVCVSRVCQADITGLLDGGTSATADAGQTVGAECASSSTCPLDQFCNNTTARCETLLDYMCRQESDCGGETPICSSSNPNAPGRCVECLMPAHCGAGETCIQPGVCTDDGTSTQPDAGPPPPPDAGVVNPPDAGVVNPPDAGVVNPPDAGVVNPPDAGPSDAGVVNPPDAGIVTPPDAGIVTPPDAGIVTPPDDDSCTFARDQVCDEPFLCTTGTDSTDCDAVTGIALNQPCVTPEGAVAQCAGGLTCVYDTNELGNPSYGACKVACQNDSHCPGSTCVLGFINATTGVCGNPKSQGQVGCEFWTNGDTFCFDQAASAALPSPGALLNCFNNTCEYLCNVRNLAEGEPGLDTPLNCPSGQVCEAGFTPISGGTSTVEFATCE